MKSSSLLVFSIIKNVEKFLDSDKNVNLFKELSIVWYTNNPEFIKKICKRIYNEIENHFYSYYDLAIFLLYYSIFYGKCDLKYILEKDINKTLEIFTKEQLQKDEKFMLELNEILNFDAEEYFKIKKEGGNILYEDLIMKRKVSPFFYLEYYTKVKREEEKESEELKQFIKVINKIKEILKIKEKIRNG